MSRLLPGTGSLEIAIPAMSVARNYEIALAELRDIPYLPSIEKAAATLLRGHAPDSVLEDATAEAEFLDAQMDGRLWVARTNDVPVGFAHGEILDGTGAHLKELDVHPEHVRRGLGSRLVMAVIAWARARQCRFVTLTTFCDVPFNMPFYVQLGFEVIPGAELSSALHCILEEEARRGLDASRRVAMRYRLGEYATEIRDRGYEGLKDSHGARNFNACSNPKFV